MARLSGAIGFFAAALLILLSSALPGRAQDMSQVQAMCSDPKAASMPQMAGICSKLSNMPTTPGDNLQGGPPASNTMTGTGPGLATPKVPAQDLQGQPNVPAPGEGGMAPAGGVPGMPGQEGGGQQPSSGGGYSPGAASGAGGYQGGSVGESHIPTIKGSFRGFSNAKDMRQRMLQAAPKPAPKPPQKTKAELAAEEAKKKEAERLEAERKKKEEEEAKKKEAERLAAEKKKEEEAKKAAEAAAPKPPPPMYENPVLSEFTLEVSVLKNVDAGKPYLGSRRVSDIGIPPPRADRALRDGVVWEVTPDFRFSLYPLEHDPFNLGFPRKPATEKGFVDRIFDAVMGLLEKKKTARAGMLRYLSFSEGSNDPKMSLLGAPGIVPMTMCWSGPDGMFAVPAAAAPAPSQASSAAPVQPSDPAQLARAWGLEP
ncbi:MAG: hypothetical protein HY927_03335 [Elusimicrobia bacterium]|nr:hypothetical protein [Elusimicrobiota bacterium]